MKKVEEMRAEYRREDLGKGVRGKHVEEFGKGLLQRGHGISDDINGRHTSPTQQRGTATTTPRWRIFCCAFHKPRSGGGV